ncbi:hypothetical protein Hdeb2414_s0059g00760171 [Helianthus debilis subsp. tardiflorus]
MPGALYEPEGGDGYSISKRMYKAFFNKDQYLIDQNQEFFKNYYFWLAVKHQNFNNLVETQTPELEIDRHRLGTLGLKLQVPPATTSALHCWPPTHNQQV